MSTFVISDTHFGHSRIIEYCNRPFNNSQEMDNYMIAQWNKVVSRDDKVWHLGDFAFGNKEYIESIIKQLNGRKILIMGNHDRRGRNWFRDIGFEEVHKTSITLGTNFCSSMGYITFTHKPIIDLSYDEFNIHGHIHNMDIKTISNYDIDSHFNVSADVIDFTPIPFEKIIGSDEFWNMKATE